MLYIVPVIPESASVSADNFGSPSVSTWFLVFCQYDGTNVQISVNSGPENSSPLSGTLNDSTSPFYISFSSLPADAYVDEAFYFSRPLSADERLWLYNNGSGRAYSELNNPPLSNPGTNGLISWWAMNETGGQRNDSHSTNHLTDNQTVGVATGLKNNASNFTSSSTEYFSVTDNPSLSPSYATIGGWVYLKSKDATQNLFVKYAVDSPSFYVYYNAATDRLVCVVHRSGDSESASVSADNFGSPSVSTWFLVFCQYDGTNVQISVNSGPENSSPLSGTLNDSTSPFYISFSSLPADAYVDEAFYFSRPLSADERLWLYNNDSGRAYSELNNPTSPTPTPTATTTAANTPTPTLMPTNTINTPTSINTSTITPTLTEASTNTPAFTATSVYNTLNLQPNAAVGNDVYILASSSSNYGNSSNLGIGEKNTATGSIARTLIKFDLSSLPANATITSATLSLWISEDLSDTNTILNAYRLKKSFNETQATWNNSATGVSWQVAGASGANDRESVSIGSITILADEPLNTEKQILLDPVKVQEMVNSTFTNNGFIIIANTELNDRFMYMSSDSSTTTQRPKLVIQYTVGGATSTATQSVATSSATNTPTLTATPTLTPTRTPTPIGSTPTSITLPTFTPVDDAYIASASPAANYGSGTTLQVDNSPTNHFLIKFDVTGIYGQQVANAKLRIYNVNASSNGGVLYQVTNNTWQEETVTWNTAPAAEPAQLASVGAVSVNNWYEVDLTSLITGDGTYSLRVSSPSTDGADYSSKEGAHPPQLIVTLGNGTPAPTQTATPTRTPTPTGPHQHAYPNPDRNQYDYANQYIHTYCLSDSHHSTCACLLKCDIHL